MVLSGSGISIDKLPNKSKNVIQSDAGTKTPSTIRERRKQFVNAFIEDAADAERTTIFWSISPSEDSDGAFVILKSDNDKESAMFFYFRNGEWSFIKDTFIKGDLR